MKKIFCHIGLHEWVRTNELKYETTFRCFCCHKFIISSNVMHPDYGKEPKHYIHLEDLKPEPLNLSPQMKLLLSRNLRQFIEVASISTINYKEVIEIRVPTRFYWNKDGSFDGIEFGKFKRELLPWQEDMVTRCLAALQAHVE